MHLRRLLFNIGAGLALAQANPIPDSTSDAPASGSGSKEHQNRPAKYFHESSFSVHYDERFASKELNETAQRDAVKVLMQTYLSNMRDLGVETWLMHGSLLGWWWNKQALPWDSDGDVQVSEKGIRFLAAYYNMTTWYFKYPRIPDGRFFQLEVNPHCLDDDDYRDGRRGGPQGGTDEPNVVDARWIDMENGLFIDITAVRYVKDHPEGEGVLATKDGHQFRDTYLYPLLETTFEGIEAKIPNKYRDMLVAEYGKDALSAKEYKDHKFIDSKMQWIASEEL